jgi:hypothetical protein
VACLCAGIRYLPSRRGRCRCGLPLRWHSLFAFAARALPLWLAFALAFAICLRGAGVAVVCLPLRWHSLFAFAARALPLCVCLCAGIRYLPSRRGRCRCVFAFALAFAMRLRGAGVAPVRGGTYFSLQRQRKVGKRKPLTPSVLVSSHGPSTSPHFTRQRPAHVRCQRFQ